MEDLFFFGKVPEIGLLTNKVVDAHQPTGLRNGTSRTLALAAIGHHNNYHYPFQDCVTMPVDARIIRFCDIIDPKNYKVVSCSGRGRGRGRGINTSLQLPFLSLTTELSLTILRDRVVEASNSYRDEVHDYHLPSLRGCYGKPFLRSAS